MIETAPDLPSRIVADGILNHLVGASLNNVPSVDEIRRRNILLAHYTSIDALYKICKSEELWFSSPFFMNDLQEMTHGLKLGCEYALRTATIEKAFSDQADASYHQQQFSIRADAFNSIEAGDVYVFCATSHDSDNHDGDLSMWRGYGAGGRGAALVFNTDFVRKHGDSPLIIAEVQYMQEHERMRSIYELLQRWQIAAAAIDQSSLQHREKTAIVESLFLSILLLSLTTKHVGFREEREWRLIYLPFLKAASLLKDNFGHLIGPTGVEPKLKFPLKPMALEPPEDWTFSSILYKILIGPGMSARLHGAAVERMLIDAGRAEFTDRLLFSSIPLRL